MMLHRQQQSEQTQRSYLACDRTIRQRLQQLAAQLDFQQSPLATAAWSTCEACPYRPPDVITSTDSDRQGAVAA